MRNVLDRCNRCVYAPPESGGFARETIPLALRALLQAAAAPGAAEQAPTAYFYAIGLTQAARAGPAAGGGGQWPADASRPVRPGLRAA